MMKELGDYKKLIESVLAAQEHMDAQRYTDAQRAYREAAVRSVYVDSLGLDYINDRLALTADYITIYDLISLGDTLALNLQYDKAEEKYLEAKAVAGKIYFDDGRKSAIDALEKLYADQKAEKEAEEADRKEQLDQQTAGANYMVQGDVAFAQGDYEGAKVYYLSAQQMYSEMEDQTQRLAAEEKLQITVDKIAEREQIEEEAQGYVQEAEEAAAEEEFVSAKKYYLLAKDVYASLKMDDKVEEIARKMERLDIKIEKQEEETTEEETTEENTTEENTTDMTQEQSPGMISE